MPNRNFKTVAININGEFFSRLMAVRDELQCSYDQAVTSIYRQLQDRIAELEEQLDDAKELVEAQEAEEAAPKPSYSELKKSYDDLYTRYNNSTGKINGLGRRLEKTQIRCAAAEQERVELKQKLSEAETKLESQKLLETKLVAIQAIIDLITR